MYCSIKHWKFERLDAVEQYDVVKRYGAIERNDVLECYDVVHTQKAERNLSFACALFSGSQYYSRVLLRNSVIFLSGNSILIILTTLLIVLQLGGFSPTIYKFNYQKLGKNV